MVISPHIYPPTITHATAAASGADLYNRLTVAHGYLSKQVRATYCMNCNLKAHIGLGLPLSTCVTLFCPLRLQADICPDCAVPWKPAAICTPPPGVLPLTVFPKDPRALKRVLKQEV